MNRWTRSVLITLGAGWLSGCALAPPAKRFTLEVDLPAQFRFIGAANYRPARYELCTLPQRRGKGRNARSLLPITNPWPNE